MDAIAAEDEIREGWYSDEARTVDRFDVVTSAQEIEAVMLRVRRRQSS